MSINVNLVKDRVRSFYATGLKSSNKVYSSSEAEKLSQTEFDSLQKGWFNKLLSSGKTNTRNENQPQSGTHRNDWHATIVNPVGSFYDAGKEIWISSLAQELRSGNCSEMGWVAGYLCINDYQLARANAYMGHVNPPGDHAFCLIVVNGVPSPAWTTPSQMTANSHNGNLCFVIDPWLNVACEACSYADVSAAKLRKWHSDGKRVSWTGGLGPGWYAPGGSYATAFQTAPLTFHAF